MKQTKRQKTVFKSSQELAHVFNSRSQTEGKTPSRNIGGNLGRCGYVYVAGVGRSASFRGDTYYSYNTAIAKFHGDVLLVTSTTYSVTTTKHVWELRSACTNRKVYSVPNVQDPRAKENIEHLANQVADAYEGCIRKSRYSVGWVRTTEAEFNNYCDTFKIKDRICVSSDDLTLLAYFCRIQGKKLKLRQANRAAQRVREIEERKKETIQDFEAWKKDPSMPSNCWYWNNYLPEPLLSEYKVIKLEREKEQFKAWKRGENVECPNVSLKYDAIRVKDGEVQTHRGASVPLKEAQLLVSALQAKKNIVGTRVGHYTVDSVDTKRGIVSIGCHTFKLSEAIAILGKEKQ